MRRRELRSTLGGMLLLTLAACEPGAQPSPSETPAAAPAPQREAVPARAAAPIYRDPLAGLYTIPASSVPADVRVDYYAPRAPRTRAVLTMAIVTGANFSRAASFVEARGLDPQPLIDAAVSTLKDRYPWLELMDDLATAQRNNVSLTVELDMRAKLEATAEIDLDVIVFDDARKPISRISVSGSGTGELSEAYATAAEAALQQLKGKATALLQ